MNKREYEDKKAALFQYQHLVRRLDQKCQEAGQWTSMAMGSGRSILSCGGKQWGSGIMDTAVSIQQEVETLATTTMAMREKLLSAIEALPDAQTRILMEARYINGMSQCQMVDKYHYTSRHIRRLLEEGVNRIQLD